MKHLHPIFILLFVLCMAFSACSSDDWTQVDEPQPTTKQTENGPDNDDAINYEDLLPQKASAFINEKLNDLVVVGIEETDNSERKFVVSFSNGLIATFDAEGIWQLLDNQQGLTQIIGRFVDAACLNEIEGKYPSAIINKLYNRAYGYCAVLSDGKALALNTANNGAYTLSGNEVLFNDLSAESQAFLNRYYSGAGFEYIVITEEPDGLQYGMLLESNTYIALIDGKYLAVHNNSGDAIPQEMIEAVMPQQLVDFMANKPDATIFSINTNINGHSHITYQYEGDKTSTVYLSPEFGVYEIPVEAIQTFIKTYLPAYDEPRMNTTFNVNEYNTVNGWYTYIVGIYFGYTPLAQMEFDKDGNWLYVTIIGEPLEDSLINALAGNLTQYMKANYPNYEINQISRSDAGYCLMITGGWPAKDVYFDFDGNFIREEDR